MGICIQNIAQEVLQAPIQEDDDNAQNDAIVKAANRALQLIDNSTPTSSQRNFNLSTSTTHIPNEINHAYPIAEEKFNSYLDDPDPLHGVRCFDVLLWRTATPLISAPAQDRKLSAEALRAFQRSVREKKNAFIELFFQPNYRAFTVPYCTIPPLSDDAQSLLELAVYESSFSVMHTLFKHNVDALRLPPENLQELLLYCWRQLDADPEWTMRKRFLTQPSCRYGKEHVLCDWCRVLYSLLKNALPQHKQTLIASCTINLDLKDDLGKTVLIRLIEQDLEDETLASFLLDCGADPNQIDNAGKNALQYALEKNRSKALMRKLSILGELTSPEAGDNDNTLPPASCCLIS